MSQLLRANSQQLKSQPTYYQNFIKNPNKSRWWFSLPWFFVTYFCCVKLLKHKSHVQKLVLIICLLFSVGSTFAYNIGLVRQASCQSGNIKSPEEPPIHASINGDMFTATFLEDLGSVVSASALPEAAGCSTKLFYARLTEWDAVFRTLGVSSSPSPLPTARSTKGNLKWSD